MRPKAKPLKTQNSVSVLKRTLVISSRLAWKWLKEPRFLSHMAVYAAVTAIVVVGGAASPRTTKASLLHQQAGQGSVLEASASASVAASVAAQTNLMVAGEASKTAGTLNSQVALPTAGDDSLAKRQVVATVGAVSHTTLSYAVAAGDTLTGIASKFNITSDTLKWANNLDDVDALKLGQSLAILPISGLAYTVKDGDTAESLATKYQANAAQIISFNNAEVKGLVAGSNIIIPDGIKVDAPKPAAVRTAVAANSYTPALTRYAYSGNGYAYGYCTYFVALKRSVPSYWGDARTWYYNAQASGFSVGSKPIPGAIAWTPAGYYGHVAYVEQVSGDQVFISEMNFNGNWNRVTYRWVPSYSFKYIY